MSTLSHKNRFLGPDSQLANYFSSPFGRWITRRIPARRSITLNRNNIFIFPTKAGFSYLAVVSLLWLLATNYENNLILALAFLLVSLFVVSILFTFGNLAGLKITSLQASPSFCGEDGELEILIEKLTQRRHENIQVGWKDIALSTVELLEDQQSRVKLYYPLSQRGWQRPSRILLQSVYPLGLLRTWTWLDLDVQFLVYPHPLKAGPIPPSIVSNGDGELAVKFGSEDFYGLKDYQLGDSLRHVAWKQYARGQKLYSKEYSATADRRLWLEWDSLQGMNRETRLSRLCYWVLECAKSQNYYGLRLPGQEIFPGSGITHRDTLLKSLALFEWNSSDSAGRQFNKKGSRVGDRIRRQVS